MAQRASLPQDAVTVSPGYTWRLDLDMKWDGARPDDWPEWGVRMHVWADGFEAFSLRVGDGISFDEVDGLPGAEGAITIPVIQMSAARSETLRGVSGPIHYVIDLTPPGGSAEDHFAGTIKVIYSPPAGLLT